jgi:arginyl-tRNA synthetase
LIANQLAQLIKTAIQTAQQQGNLPPFDLPQVVVEHPKDPNHGDYATPVAMGLARLARLAPRQIAEKIAAHLEGRSSAKLLSPTQVSSIFVWQKAGYPASRNNLAEGENLVRST